ncbi:MAG TPA: SPOR domain-containing protein [Candidatus Limnocylindrales bacterium]|nr:SPOR domain-containing protein [Candidatus Limnocylindrales bacterium]
MAAVETYPERYADPLGFAREVNLPLLGTARVRPVPPGAGLAQLLDASSSSDSLAGVVESLTETRRSLTLRSLLLAGFPHDPECFAVGLSIAREWSRRGLRVAVVDLDFWHPTISRPPSHHNEGWVDVLEYGCSFGRVAWEIVADRLWVIGPGTYPPEEARISEHADWHRAGRVMAACADVVIYVAPLLDHVGFTGKLSKRMDAAILATSVSRAGRTELRDAFLELWGSDAPMIGCVGIEAVHAPSKAAAASAPAAPRPAAAASAPAAPRDPDPRTETPSPPVPRRTVQRIPVPPPQPPMAINMDDWADEPELEAALERDVRHGLDDPTPKRGRAWLMIGIIALLGLTAAAAGYFIVRRSAPPRGSVQSRQPAGEEPIAPASPLPRSPLDEEMAPPEELAAPPAGTATGAAPSAADPARSADDPLFPFRVHVASFRTQSKVQEMVQALRDQKLDAWFEPPAPGAEWYRVFVGRFATEADASAYAAWLVQNGLVERAHSYPPTER